VKKLTGLIFALAFISLPIDSFPLGASLLKEFGARLSNFFLFSYFILCLVFVLTDRLRLRPVEIFAIFGLTFLLSCGFFLIDESVAQYYHHRPPELSYLLQSMMVIWASISFFLWVRLLENGCANQRIINLSCAVTFAFLIADLIIVKLEAYSAGEKILGWVQFYHDPFRVSGLTSEPSILGAWLALLWPMVFFRVFSLEIKNYFILDRRTLLTILIVFSGFLWGGRTFPMLFSIQASWLIFSATRKTNALWKTFFFVLLGGLASATMLWSYHFVFDINSNLSSMARLGASITAIQASIDNLPFGIGAGQFSYYFGLYVDDIFLLSEEVQAWADGESASRTSTFNLFIRAILEFGFLGSIAVGLFFLKFALMNKSVFEKVNLGLARGVTLTLIGGCGFWLTQDQYGYQPAIFSLALLYYHHRKHRNTLKEAFHA